MLLRTVPARAGMQWVKLGFVWFMRQPGRVITLVVPYLLFAALLSMVPVVGGLLPLLAMQIVTVGFMAAGRAVARGEPVSPALLLSGLRGDPRRVRALLGLSVFYVGAVLAALGVGALADDGATLRMLIVGTMPSAARMQDGSIGISVLLSMLAYLPVSMAFWFAPVLVSWHGMGSAQALFTSLIVVWRNLRAFAVFELQWSVVSTVVLLLAALLAQALGASEDETMLIALPALLALYLAFLMSFYATAQDLLVDDEAGARPATTSV